MKIIHFMDTFGAGGIEANFITVIKHWDYEYEFKVVCLNKTSTFHDEILLKRGIQVEALMERQANPIIRYFKGLKRLYKFFKSLDKDTAIHFHISHGVDFLYVFISKLAGVRIRIAHCHSSGVNSRYKYIGHVILKKLFVNTPTHFLSCSMKGANWLYTDDIVKNKVMIIPNAIDMKEFVFKEDIRKKLRKELNLSNELTLICASRLTKEKNHEFMIDIISALVHKGFDVSLLIIGDGVLEDFLFEKIQNLGLVKEIKMLGFREDVSDLLNAGDIYISTSKYEGFQIAVVEAQANGLPCVISSEISKEVKITEYVEFLDLSIGCQAWAEKIMNMNHESNRVLENEICQRSLYDYHHAIEKWKELYGNLFQSGVSDEA